MFFIFGGVIMPVIFIIYNVVCYSKRKVIYTIKDNNLTIIDDRFFKLQLSLSIVNAIFVSLIVYIWEKYMNSLGCAIFIIIYWGINYLIKYIGIFKKYAEVRK